MQKSPPTLMAAYASLVSLMNIINDLQHHPSPPITLDRQLVDPITKHITFFLEFLEFYNPPPCADEEEAADPLEMRIADAAYAAEDAIETHIVETIQLQSNFDNGSKITHLMNCFQAPKKPKNPIDERLKSINLYRDSLQRVIEEMKSIEKVVVVKFDAEKNKKMALMVHDQVALTNVPASVARNSTMVGSDGALQKILEMLIGGRPDFQVIPIVGMGGIGKTFLAIRVYSRPLIKEHFDICAWVTISQQYNTREILCELLSQDTNTKKEQLSGKSGDILGLELHKYLFGRRFVIVMDDMWNIDAWDKIQCFFPNNGNGSRVLVTTRLSLIQVIHDLQHHPSPPIPLDKHLVESITQHISYFEEFLHAYNTPPPVAEDDEEEVVVPLAMHIAAAAYAAEDAIETHIVETIQLQRRCRDRLISVIEEMDTARSETFVGSDRVSLEIIEKLIRGRSFRQAIPIVGMGGIGKTFLANSIYADPRVKVHFYTCAWATISQEYNTKEILRDLLSQATNTKKEQLRWKSEDELGLELHKTLFGRRFLIVMDDIWSIDAWDKIQRFFPSNENGSRVLVTTRLSQLCSQLNNDYKFPMSFLDETTSWDLFSRTVFGVDKCFPSELKEIGEKIVEKCRGLPLSIVVVGGLLKKLDDTPASWESIQDNLTSVVNMENDNHCLGLLKLSYNYLPVFLKPCFLHLGLFEEDKEIRASEIVKLWVSEGFLKPMNGEALERTARGFLHDLVDRNLVLISKLGATGGIKSIKIHDLVRDLCLKEGHRKGLYLVLGGECNLPPQGMNIQRRVVVPWRYRLSMYDNGDLRSMSHTRSITCYGELPPSSNLGLLRTLRTITNIESDHVNSLAFHHVNLRHLDIKVCVRKLSLDSVSLLWNLHTLIVSGKDKMILLVNDFWKMTQLRHIEIVGGLQYLLELPNRKERYADDFAIMENLHTLKGVKNLNFCEGLVDIIPNVKILKMLYDDRTESEKDEEFYVENVQNLSRLESLSVGFCSYHLHNKITFPHSLKKLSLLIDFECEWNGMLDIIGSLPRLEKLKLLCGSFRDGKLETSEGQFPRLKYLKLRWCPSLQYWTAAGEGSDILPRLEHLCLYGFRNLKTIPCELGNIDTLKSIDLGGCGEEAVKLMKEIFDEQVELQGGADQLSFHVEVSVGEEQQDLLSLSGPNFQVII